METAIKNLEQSYRKPALPQVMSGDTVRVHQLIREGNKQRIQIFEGVIIRRHRLGELTATITVRRIASNVGVEKTFLMHSPNVTKIEILRRAKVRRNFLSYLRERRGKSARLKEITFDKVAANDVSVPEAPSVEELDQTTTEINAVVENDALNDAVSLDGEVKAEERAARLEDESTLSSDADEADAPAQEVEKGLEKADPNEEKAL